MSGGKYLPGFFLICMLTSGSVFTQIASSQFISLDAELAETANIDFDILQILRSETDSAFSQLTTSSYVFNKEENAYVRTVNKQKGIVFNSDAESAYNLVFKLRDNFFALGHLIFISEEDKAHNIYKIAVIKSSDQFDILRLMQTNGENYNIFNKDVINKLTDWNNKFPFAIIGAGNDWVEAMFQSAPSNAETFANDVYEFCPDVVDSGSGSVKYLADELKDTGILYLWWE